MRRDGWRLSTRPLESIRREVWRDRNIGMRSVERRVCKEQGGYWRGGVENGGRGEWKRRVKSVRKRGEERVCEEKGEEGEHFQSCKVVGQL